MTVHGWTKPAKNASNKLWAASYYPRAVDPTILMVLSEISSQQTAPTENSMKHINHFLDYMWTHPDAVIRYRASDMILNVNSDASYLSAPKAHRQLTTGWQPHQTQRRHPCPMHHPQTRCCIRSRSQTRCNVSECTRCQSFCLILAKLGHPQPPTLMPFDNTTTVGIVNNTIKQQQSRSMELRYF